jgi:hypothetical protein
MLCFAKYHAIETYDGVEVQLQTFLTSALDEGEWSGSRLFRFASEERASGIYYIRDWVGPPESVWTRQRREKKPCPYLESNPDRSAPNLVTIN